MGGENFLFSFSREAASGSSPRGRGKPDNAVALVTTNRLIPAWAGKTLFVIGYPHGEPAHPRVGGENFTLVQALDIDVGSSPRGRGKPRVRARIE